MAKSGKKPRHKLDPRKFEEKHVPVDKREQDWSFDEIARSKTRRR